MFWDSSAVVPLIVTEESTATMTAMFEDDPQMLVWWATSIECESALTRLRREGRLGTRAVASAAGRLDTLAGTWHEVQPVESVRRLARRLLRTHPLRAADSLQLAAALVAAENDPGSLDFVSLDARLVDAATTEGLSVSQHQP